MPRDRVENQPDPDRPFVHNNNKKKKKRREERDEPCSRIVSCLAISIGGTSKIDTMLDVNID